MKLFAAWIVLSVNTAVHAQSIHDLFGTDKFHRAYFVSETKEVSFEGFQNLNWEAKARTALPWLNLDRPTASQIARLSTFESAGPQFRSVDFRAPLDPAIGRAGYLLIHADGITLIRPTQLKGSVSFDFDKSLTIVQRKVASGVVVAEPARPVRSAAFAIMGALAEVHDVHVGARFENRRQSGPAAYDFTDGSRTVSWTASSTEQPAVETAISFHLSSEQLLLVKWSSDVCGSAYTLFSVDTTLKPIAGNNYDCDP